MTIYRIYLNIRSLRPQLRSYSANGYLVNELEKTLYRLRLSEKRDIMHSEISKVKLHSSFPRKVVVRVFKRLGLKVTNYTREYGKTIVHFEPLSDS